MSTPPKTRNRVFSTNIPCRKVRPVCEIASQQCGAGLQRGHGEATSEYLIHIGRKRAGKRRGVSRVTTSLFHKRGPRKASWNERPVGVRSHRPNDDCLRQREAMDKPSRSTPLASLRRRPRRRQPPRRRRPRRRQRRIPRPATRASGGLAAQHLRNSQTVHTSVKVAHSRDTFRHGAVDFCTFLFF